MTTWPDADALRAFLARVTKRLTILSAAHGAAVGFFLAFVLAIVGWPGAGAVAVSVTTGLVLAALGVIAFVWGARIRRAPVAQIVEIRAPHCKNIVITAHELIAIRDGAPTNAAANTPDYVARIVCRDAARIVDALDPATLFPGRRAAVALALSSAVWLLAVLRIAAPVSSSFSNAHATVTSAVVKRLDVSVTPPAYAGQQSVSTHDPARIEALAGSRIHLTVHADAGSVVVETLGGKAPLVESPRGVFTGDVPADADGFIAIEPATSTGTPGARRLVGLTVLPDHPPRVRIVKPGQDLFLKDANHVIDLSIDATDDIGLASLRLRYTKVSGSGERFTFSEGEVPIAVTRATTRAWTASAHWNIAGLSLSPGDMVVYRAVAADQRPGATAVESDSYIAEILAPGMEAAAGFALDPDQERYAVSQQMVILKTERLAAKRTSMSVDDFMSASQEIGVEQRKVRAEFVFMMGGEIADAPDPTANMNDLNETAEAAGEADLAAGRMANQGRIALVRATRSMSRAATALTTADVGPALIDEKAALAQLEQAFSRTRIILRALTQRDALDMTRRLTGALADAARDVHPSADPQRDPRVVALRQALASIAALAGDARRGNESGEMMDLAQRILQVDPSAKSLQTVASLLGEAASASGAGHSSDVRQHLDEAATALAAALHSDFLIAPGASPSADVNRLSGSLADELRGARVRR